jgi:predicted secreted protein
MKVGIRVLGVLACVFALTCWGCAKKEGTQASAPSPDTAEAAKADARESNSAPKAKTAPAKIATAKKATTSHEAETKAKAAQRASAHSGILTEADNGMEFDFHQGQTVTLVLDSNHSNGLSWSTVGSGDVLAPQGTAAYAARTGGGTETWHFRAAKPGHQTVKMEYRRKWAQSVPERTFRFSANVR